MTFRIGIISDTHGLLRQEVECRLAGADHIIHGGDIGRPEIIDALLRIAPVTTIRGNVDIGDWALAYPETDVVRLTGKSLYVLHDLKTLQIDPIARGIDVVVSGHSHVPKIDTADSAPPAWTQQGPSAHLSGFGVSKMTSALDEIDHVSGRMDRQRMWRKARPWRDIGCHFASRLELFFRCVGKQRNHQIFQSDDTDPQRH